MNMQLPKYIPRWVWVLAIGAFIVGIPWTIWLPRYTTSNSKYCLRCHGSRGGLPNRGIKSKVHPSYSKVSCVDCHAKSHQIVYEGYVKGFMAETERITPNCIKCHSGILKRNDTRGFKFNIQNIEIPHRLHLQLGARCTDCHVNIAHDLRSKQTNRPRMEYCSQCHATTVETCTKCHTKGIPPGPIPPVPPAGLVGDGKGLYDRYCAECHGLKGDEVKGVNLRSRELFTKNDLESIKRMVIQGHGKMPVFGAEGGGPLSDDEIRAIIAYIKLSTEGVVANGQALFESYCAVCHGAKGDKMPTVNLSSADFVGKLSSDQIVKMIRQGKAGMPAFSRMSGGPLGYEEVVAVARYISSLSAPTIPPAIAALKGPEASTLYRDNCTACHGEKGQEIETANLGSKGYLKGLGDKKLFEAIANGSEAMPAFGKKKGGKLSDEEIKLVIEYLKSMAGMVPKPTVKPPMQKAPRIPHELGKDMEECLECHGQGGIKPTPPDHAGRTVKVCRTCHFPR